MYEDENNEHLFALIQVDTTFEFTAASIRVILQKVLTRQFAAVTKGKPSLSPSLFEKKKKKL